MSQYPEPPIAGADVSSRAAARMTDEKLLRREADWARAAMSRATEKIKRGAMHAADPTAWAETHPWMSVGTAAAAGFAAAKVICTPREERVIAKYLRAVRRGEADASASGAAVKGAEKRSGWMPGLLSLLQTAAMQIPAILAQMQAADVARAAASNAAADNGTTSDTAGTSGVAVAPEADPDVHGGY